MTAKHADGHHPSGNGGQKVSESAATELNGNPGSGAAILISSPLEGALWAAAKGWPVYPVTIGHNKAKCDGGTANCKTTSVRGSWKRKATTDPKKIKAWPEFNAYLIDCEAADIAVADQDPGDDWPFDAGVIVATGRGCHHYYVDLIGLGTTVSLQPWGVDVRAVGGAIYGPGSYHPHGSYSLVKDDALTGAPPEFVAALQQPPSKPAAPEATYAGPGYAALPEALQRRASSLQESRVAKWQRTLEASTLMEEHERGAPNHEGKVRGWEVLSRDFAFALAIMVATPWLPMTYEEAEAVYEETLPQEYQDEGDDNLIKGIPTPAAVAQKIKQGKTAPIGPPPWEEEMDSGEDGPGQCRAAIKSGARCPNPVTRTEDDLSWAATCEEHRNVPFGELRPPDREEDEPNPGDSWKRQDVAEMLGRIDSGAVVKIKPTVGATDTGDCLFYPGRINTVFGESTSGKTWVTLLATKQEVESGHNVFFIDFEDDLTSALLRLLDIGTDREALIERFHYISPEESLSKQTRQRLIRTLAKIEPTLVVIDSTGESLALEGKNPNADEDVAEWIRWLPKACTRSGAAVVVVDHIPKAEGANGAPIGSQRKRAATFAAYRVEAVRPFAKGIPGAALIVANKDKAGHYRKDDVIAGLEAQPGEDVELDLRLTRVVATEASSQSEWDERLLRRICTYLQRAVEESADEDWPGASTNYVTAAVGGNASRARKHLERLVDLGHVKREKRGQTNYHTLLSVYVPDAEFAEGTE